MARARVVEVGLAATGEAAVAAVMVQVVVVVMAEVEAAVEDSAAASEGLAAGVGSAATGVAVAETAAAKGSARQKTLPPRRRGSARGQALSLGSEGAVRPALQDPDRSRVTAIKKMIACHPSIL